MIEGQLEEKIQEPGLPGPIETAAELLSSLLETETTLGVPQVEALAPAEAMSLDWPVHTSVSSAAQCILTALQDPKMSSREITTCLSIFEDDNMDWSDSLPHHSEINSAESLPSLCPAPEDVDKVPSDQLEASYSESSFKTPGQLKVLSAVYGRGKCYDDGFVGIEGKFGEDAYFRARHKHLYFLGVADGVGGSRKSGGDPGRFSFSLLDGCKRYVNNGLLKTRCPLEVFDAGYKEMNKSIKGSTTVCVLMIDTTTRPDNPKARPMLKGCNLGDSGFMVIRDGAIHYKSKPMQYRFNSPRQLGTGSKDRPSDSELTSIGLQEGDMIVLATDGVFDNLSDEMLIKKIDWANQERRADDEEGLLTIAKDTVESCLRIANNGVYESPYSKAAKAVGKNHPGGKADDVTLILATLVKA